MEEMQRIAVIGTGIMGGPMAGRLADAGFQVVAWNRTRDKADALSSRGVVTAASAAQAAADADVVICMLSSGPVCEDVLLGDHGVVATMKPAAALVVMSSIPVETAVRLGERAVGRGLAYCDAPVSGGEKGAREGTRPPARLGKAQTGPPLREVRFAHS